MTEFAPPATRYFALPSPFLMHRGGVLQQARVAYETWGQLNADASNAILILTGLSPSAHAASSADDPQPGWWEPIIGPGKAIDTDRWFVVCVNHLGSCKGSTGAASIDPETGAAYRLTFPDLSVEDMGEAAYALMQGLGVTQLACLVGCSMGAMAALALLVQHPEFSRSHINACGAARALPFSIAVRSLQREAIRLDPHWQEGQYDEANYPDTGMRLARKLGVITYRSSLEWNGRFGRVRMDEVDTDTPFSAEFVVESYLDGHADRFAHFFDPNCYLYLGRAMDWFDIGEHAIDPHPQVHCEANVVAALSRTRVGKALVLGAITDILFPIPQQEEIAAGLAASGADVRFHAVPSEQGHDAFLVDHERFGALIGAFLKEIV